jgi:flagellar hook-associated protein 3 FlgL
MRVTNNMMSNDLLRSLNRNMYRMLALQTQIATGKKINKPSDDPAGLVTSLRLRTNLVEGEQYLENIGDSITFMDTLDSSLNSIGEVMQKIRELTVKAATGSNSDEANEAIAVEIADLNEELKMIANVTYGNKYIFAGTNVTEEPYQDGVWTGNQRALEVEIGVGVTTTINLPGMKEFFMGRLNDLILNSGTSGITSLTANALQEGEYTLKTAIGATAQSRATETQNYLGALANNGEFFYQDVNSAATLEWEKTPLPWPMILL